MENKEKNEMCKVLLAEANNKILELSQQLFEREKEILELKTNIITTLIRKKHNL